MAPDRRGARVLGRYVLHDEFASGGMAAVHFGRLVAEAGFTRTVAIKRLHPQHAKDPAFVAMLLDEARLAGRIRHPNVAPILDVVQTDGEVFLVMEYVHGESLASLARATVSLGSPIPARLASSVISGVLHGLHAAHVAMGETGEALGIVHRDMSPENVIVGIDGAPRVLDFGIALASGRSQVTREGGLKGKLGYMAPELMEGQKATPVSDVYSVGVVLWEALTGERLFTGEHEGAILARVLKGAIVPPSQRAAMPPGADEVVMRALARQPEDRYRSADDFALGLESAIPPAPARDVAAWVNAVAGGSLSRRAAMVAEVEGARPATHESNEDAKSAPISTTEVMRTLRIAQGTPSKTRVIGPVGEHLVTESLAPPRFGETTDSGAVSRGLSKAHARRTGAIVIVAVAAIALIATTVVLSSNGSEPRASTSSDVTALPSPSAPSASPLEVGAASASPSASTAEVVIEPEPAVTARVAEPSAKPSLAASASGARLPPSTRIAHPPPVRGGPCDPPYTIDERGLHHYKPGCL